MKKSEIKKIEIKRLEKKSFKVLILLFSILYSLFSAIYAEININASVDKNTVNFGDSIILQVVVSGDVSNIPKPELPSLTDFNVYSSGTSQNISFVTAALGAEIDVQTLDGEISLKIPAGTQPGTKFRLRGKGVPYLHSPGRGYMYVLIDVEVPKKLSRRQRKLLEDFEEK